MNRFLGSAMGVAVTFSGISFATGVDSNDSVLVAYQLTAAQSTEFSTTDNAVSPFWDLIDEASHDFWKLLPSTHAYLQGSATGFVNDSDAQATIKAAYDSAGAYFYFRVLDNQWMTGDGWQPDVVDLYIDNHSSSSIIADPTVYVNGYLTSTCQQYWITIGGDVTPATIGLNYWDSNQPAFTNSILDMTAASQKIEVIKLDSINRVLEMFVPWTNFGGGGVSVLAPEGTQYAISGGYNDLDSTTFAANCLRILHNGDPYQTMQNYWADLELGPQIDAQMLEIKISPRLRASALASGNIMKSEYFSIAGRKVDKPAFGKHRILIRRDRMDNGTIAHTIIRK